MTQQQTKMKGTPIKVGEIEVYQLSPNAWQGLSADGHFDFHIQYEGDVDWAEGPYTVDIFRARISDPTEAHVETFGAETLPEAVAQAHAWSRK